MWSGQNKAGRLRAGQQELNTCGRLSRSEDGGSHHGLGGPNSNPQICCMQCGNVIDAISAVSNSVAQPLQHQFG